MEAAQDRFSPYMMGLMEIGYWNESAVTSSVDSLNLTRASLSDRNSPVDIEHETPSPFTIGAIALAAAAVVGVVALILAIRYRRRHRCCGRARDKAKPTDAELGSSRQLVAMERFSAFTTSYDQTFGRTNGTAYGKTVGSLQPRVAAKDRFTLSLASYLLPDSASRANEAFLVNPGNPSSQGIELEEVERAWYRDGEGEGEEDSDSSSDPSDHDSPESLECCRAWLLGRVDCMDVIPEEASNIVDLTDHDNSNKDNKNRTYITTTTTTTNNNNNNNDHHYRGRRSSHDDKLYDIPVNVDDEEGGSSRGEGDFDSYLETSSDEAIISGFQTCSEGGPDPSVLDTAFSDWTAPPTHTPYYTCSEYAHSHSQTQTQSSFPNCPPESRQPTLQPQPQPVVPLESHHSLEFHSLDHHRRCSPDEFHSLDPNRQNSLDEFHSIQPHLQCSPIEFHSLTPRPQCSPADFHSLDHHPQCSPMNPDDSRPSPVGSNFQSRPHSEFHLQSSPSTSSPERGGSKNSNSTGNDSDCSGTSGEISSGCFDLSFVSFHPLPAASSFDTMEDKKGLQAVYDCFDPTLRVHRTRSASGDAREDKKGLQAVYDCFDPTLRVHRARSASVACTYGGRRSSRLYSASSVQSSAL